MTKVGMGELESAVEPGHLARKDASGSRHQLAVPIADQSWLPEESAGEGPPMVGNRDLQSRLRRRPIARTTGEVEGAGVDHLCHHRGLFTLSEEGKIAQLGTGEIAPWHMSHQVADCKDLQRLELLGGLRTDDLL